MCSDAANLCVLVDIFLLIADNKQHSVIFIKVCSNCFDVMIDISQLQPMTQFRTESPIGKNKTFPIFIEAQIAPCRYQNVRWSLSASQMMKLWSIRIYNEGSDQVLSYRQFSPPRYTANETSYTYAGGFSPKICGSYSSLIKLLVHTRMDSDQRYIARPM